MINPTVSPSPAKTRQGTLLRVAIALILTIATVLAYHHRDTLDPIQLTAWVQGWGTAGMAIFVLLYILATILFLPGSVLTLAGGALFGPWLGGALSLAGATIGAGIAFLIARHLAGDWVMQRAGGMAGRLLAGVEAEGWRFVAFVRLVPIFPFNLLNYALGLTRIRLDHYLLASLVCMAPGGLAYAWMGYAGKEMASGSAGAIHAGMWAMGLLTVALLIPRWLKQAREAKRHLTTTRLREMLEAKENMAVLDVRDAADFVGENGHVPGSINIPLPELESRLDEIRQWNRPVAILCHTDRRSTTAFRRLDTLGIGPLFLVIGGIKQWRQENAPVER
ncbi:MAG: VTT domain-containing protein [Magnetococcales bacterium]|nr:VTT domain-containing protein [Magnetococcales bacterium]